MNKFNIEQLYIAHSATILALATGTADYNIQNSTLPKALPPAWFRSTGTSLFNHTCFTLLYYIYYILMIIILRVKHGIDVCIRYNVFIRKHTINRCTSVIIDISRTQHTIFQEFSSQL